MKKNIFKLSLSIAMVIYMNFGLAGDNPFREGYHQDTNPFGDGYIQNDNPVGEGYIQKDNPFGEGHTDVQEVSIFTLEFQSFYYK